jgi:beta-glucosidase/6-phospho-beta-glucosidase/beta-galactosidase
MPDSSPFKSFFQAGFECSSHCRPDGVRLDLLKGTAHDRHALQDYRRCASAGLLTVRDGLRWHVIEQSRGRYDWSDWKRMLEAAQKAGVEVIWDLFHYGSPDHVDQGSEEFIPALCDFAAEAMRVHRSETGRAASMCPVNEISFMAWAVKTGYFPPVGPMLPGWFKRHLTKAAIAAAKTMRSVEPDCRLIGAEPLIHIAPKDHSRAEKKAAETLRIDQFQTYDRLTGREEPELGGSDELIDVIGLNFYPHNQWYLDGPTIPMGHHEYRALSDMLVEVGERYGKPIFIAETGAEGSGRAAWLHYVCQEVREAMSRGVRIRGICIYPDTAYPGWDNMRHADVGLFSAAGANGRRDIYEPLYEELQRQAEIFAVDQSLDPMYNRQRVAGGGRY